jgi:hypothetical protein
MQTISGRREATAWQEAHDAHAPSVGDAAPDFELRDTAGENPQRLSEYRGKTPVALVFGSFT